MRAIIGIVLLIFLIAGWSSFWLYTAKKIEQHIVELSAGFIFDNYKFNYSGFELDGYPFRIRVKILLPSITENKTSIRPIWQTKYFAVTVHPWKLQHVVGDLSGEHTLYGTPLDESVKLRLIIPEGNASLVSDAAETNLVSIDLRGTTTFLQNEPFNKCGRCQLHVRTSAEKKDVLDFSFKLEKLKFLGNSPMRLGTTIGSFSSEGSVMGYSDIKKPNNLQTWRDKGGIINLRRASIDWGNFKVDAIGTVGFDNNMQPIATMTAQIEGHDHLVDALVEMGELSDSNAAITKATLALLAISSKGVLKLPLRLRNGSVFLGPIKIAQFPPNYLNLIKVN